MNFSPVLMERDNRKGGSWREVTLPELPAGTDVQVTGADASSRSSGVLVGELDEDLGGMLTERWNGSSWRVVPAPTPKQSLGASLLDVEDFSPSNAWAVGYAQILDGTVPDPDGGLPHQLDHFEPVVRHWDGTAWQVVNMPDVADSWYLQSMTAVSPHDIWAVGRTQDLKPVVVHYDGTSWSHVPVPAASGELRSVVASGPHDVWAVGGMRNADDTGAEALALRFDGTAWHRVPMPAGTGVLDHGTATPLGVAFSGNTDAPDEGDRAPFGIQVEDGRVRPMRLPTGITDVTLTAMDSAGPGLLMTGFRVISTDTTYGWIPVLLTGCW
ncbi:hypothetical protein ACGFNV_25890 [Streptomyces sp. NPDC048751]|uniref:hypothetical protein n=1 Tax=Streptomyces sp. NPDC048751 TaxID=3365591 RepID=UPI003717CA19